MAIPLIAGKKGADAAQGAGKALLGDIYTRRWTSQVGKGKHKKLVDHELKVNPVSIGLGAVAVGVAAAGAAVALWMTQRKVTKTEGKDIVLIIDQFDTTYKTVTKTRIEDVPTLVGGKVWIMVPTTVTYEETVVDVPGYFIVKSKKGVPYKNKVEGMATADNVLLQAQISAGYAHAGEISTAPIYNKTGKVVGTRKWWKFHTDKKSTYGIGERTGLFTS